VQVDRGWTFPAGTYTVTGIHQYDSILRPSLDVLIDGRSVNIGSRWDLPKARKPKPATQALDK
jgi:hypothetical protein